MPCWPGSTPVVREASADAVVVGKPESMTDDAVNAPARVRACPDRALRAAAPSPSTSTTIALFTTGSPSLFAVPSTAARQLGITSARLIRSLFGAGNMGAIL